MFLAHNGGNSIVTERFIKTLKGKIYKKMTANDRKSYLNYLNKLVDESINKYHRSIGKTPIDADYSALSEEIQTNPEASKFKVHNRVRITNKIIFLAKFTLKIGQKKYLLLVLR